VPVPKNGLLGGRTQARARRLTCSAALSIPQKLCLERGRLLCPIPPLSFFFFSFFVVAGDVPVGGTDIPSPARLAFFHALFHVKGTNRGLNERLNRYLHLMSIEGGYFRHLAHRRHSPHVYDRQKRRRQWRVIQKYAARQRTASPISLYM
jgi:hypothetical protein